MQLDNPIIKSKKNVILTIIILMLVFGNIFFAVKYFLQIIETEKLQKETTRQKTNVKVINFLSLFIQKVLRTDKEVSFENRLKLENAIRDINDPEILSKWEKFTGATDESEIQNGVKDLLEVLVNKITY